MIQAVILAAGESTRCFPLTITRPKALLKIANKTIIEYTLNQLKGLVNEAIIVVGYKKEMIQELLGDKYDDIAIKYVEQTSRRGTGHALLQVKEHITGKFIMLYGDDLYMREDIEACLKNKYSILAYSVEDPSRFGLVNLKQGDILDNIIEKPENPKGNLANIGVYVFDEAIFDMLEKTKESIRGEIELPDTINMIAEQKLVKVIEAENWIPNGYPWHLLDSNKFLLDSLTKNKILGEVEKGATIKGTVHIGKGTVVKSGTYIEGPVIIGENCVLGPNCYIRPYTTIGNNCKVGQAVEIKNTIIFDNSKVPHLSYIGDSVIGENVNLGAGTITANLKHDSGGVKSVVNDKLIDTGRKKLGTVVGDGAKTGINTQIYPGRKIWPGKTTLPGEIIKKDVM